MRIGFDAKRFFHNKTGLGQYSRSLISALNTYYPDAYQIELFSPGVLPPSSDSILHKRINTWQRNIKSASAYNDLDLYHGLSNQLPHFPQKGLKHVVTIHDLIFLRYPSLYKSFDRKVYKLKTIRSCENADKIIAISEQTKRDLVSLLHIPPNKISVVYQSADPIFYTSQASAEALPSDIPSEYILFVGGLAGRKNGAQFLQAYAKIAPQQRLPIVFVGSSYSKLTKEVRDIIENKHLRSHLRFLSYVPTPVLRQLYQKARWTIYPSVFEGYGVPIIESLTQKTAVLCAHAASMPEAAGPGGIYFDPYTKDDLFHKLEYILSIPEGHYQDIVENGHRHVLQHTHPRRFAEQMHAVYQSC